MTEILLALVLVVVLLSWVGDFSWWMKAVQRRGRKMAHFFRTRVRW